MHSLSRYIFQAVLFLTGLLVLSCENDMKKVDELTQKRSVDDEALGVTSFMSEDGVMKARLTAPFMIRHQTDSAFLEFPKNLHVDFYNDSVVIESVLDAKYGKYHELERKVFLRDSVVVINVLKKDTLKTNELWWDQNKQEFYTDKPVEIHQPDKTIFGVGLKAAQNFDWYDFYHVTGTVLTNSDALQ